MKVGLRLRGSKRRSRSRGSRRRGTNHSSDAPLIEIPFDAIEQRVSSTQAILLSLNQELRHFISSTLPALEAQIRCTEEPTPSAIPNIGKLKLCLEKLAEEHALEIAREAKNLPEQSAESNSADMLRKDLETIINFRQDLDNLEAELFGISCGEDIRLSDILKGLAGVRRLANELRAVTPQAYKEGKDSNS